MMRVCCRLLVVGAALAAAAACPPPAPPPVTPAGCGDGILHLGEKCDLGAGNGDGPGQCRATCVYPGCGDGVLDDVVGAFTLVAEQCDDGNKLPGDGCSPACFDEALGGVGADVGGVVRNREYRDVNVQAGVTVRIPNATCPPDAPPESPTALCESAPSIGAGFWSIDQVPANSAIVLEARYPESYDVGAGPQPVPATFATRVKAYTNESPVQTIDALLLRYNSVAQIAVDCGVYPDLNAALGSADWATYAAFFGQVKDIAGAGKSGVPKTALYARIGAEVNDTVTRANQTYFCWLADDAAAPGKLKGGTAATSSTGYFMIFKARNEAGSGAGNAYLGLAPNVPNAPLVAEASVPVEAGQIGVVTLVEIEAPVVDVLRSYQYDVYPLLYQTLGCANCHYNGGPGYNGPNQLDFTGNPAEVYGKLTGGGTLCAQSPGEYPVCLNDPLASRVLLKPLLGYAEDNGLNPVAWHPNASFQDETDPNFLVVKQWIDQGAVNDYDLVVVNNQPYLDNVMVEFEARGCTACHAGAAPSGNLSLDGCNPAFDYAAVGVDPLVAQDCVYYHLKNEAVADDPYQYGYRVNPDQPERSMLLRNPYCGPTGDAICDPPETHPLRIWPDRDVDPSYQLILEWIEGGALNNYAP